MNDDDNLITLDISGIDLSDTISVDDDYSTYGINASGNYDFNLDFGSFNINPGLDVHQGDINIHHDGDIKLGEQSLKEFMNKVEERLNILQPNPELEQQWDELRELGKKYRELEQELLEKQTMWEKLKEQ